MQELKSISKLVALVNIAMVIGLVFIIRPAELGLEGAKSIFISLLLLIMGGFLLIQYFIYKKRKNL